MYLSSVSQTFWFEKKKKGNDCSEQLDIILKVLKLIYAKWSSHKLKKAIDYITSPLSYLTVMICVMWQWQWWRVSVVQILPASLRLSSVLLQEQPH